ncbi:prephenate dehydrogenase [Shewanella sp. NIFS-20-20]|uniref:prephenate dehydrogenase n=1 Tax=Shewanella sp. NIFS-20-20 TaxID=2853806 RepID=UPI001C4842BA|nr:prephenate dehydrogenase [Shewanella sp. NIFS-20-20]MBV7316187.1 prephenate dehydrogenase [Shewanella sp. NIFS-20-20]
MPYSRILEQLQQNLQLAYRQAIDADAKLDALQHAGHAKFTTIFKPEQGFTHNSKRFLPYVKDLAQELAQLPQDAVDTEQLQALVKKLALVLSTLQAFKQQS